MITLNFLWQALVRTTGTGADHTNPETIIAVTKESLRAALNEACGEERYTVDAPRRKSSSANPGA